MSDADSYDPTRFADLGRELEALRNEARESGILREQPAPRSRAVGPDDKGKAAAAVMLRILRHGSPIVPGTDCSEQGVSKLLQQLAAPRKPGASSKIFQGMNKFLTTPPPAGAPLVAGVSVEKIVRLTRLLEQIEKHGWAQVRAMLALRRDVFIDPVCAEAPSDFIDPALDQPHIPPAAS